MGNVVREATEFGEFCLKVDGFKRKRVREGVGRPMEVSWAQSHGGTQAVGCGGPGGAAALPQASVVGAEAMRGPCRPSRRSALTQTPHKPPDAHCSLCHCPCLLLSGPSQTVKH